MHKMKGVRRLFLFLEGEGQDGGGPKHKTQIDCHVPPREFATMAQVDARRVVRS